LVLIGFDLVEIIPFQQFGKNIDKLLLFGAGQLAPVRSQTSLRHLRKIKAPCNDTFELFVFGRRVFPNDPEYLIDRAFNLLRGRSIGDLPRRSSGQGGK
jgi:hypothetical protein